MNQKRIAIFNQKLGVSLTSLINIDRNKFQLYLQNDISSGTSSQDEVFCLAYSKKEPTLAAGYANGMIALYDTANPTKFKLLKNSEYPITSIKWKPNAAEILVAAYSDGRIIHWHSKSGKQLSFMNEEKENPIMSLDFDSTGDKFATGGNDKIVRIYDDNMKIEIAKMKPNGFELPGHSNRIFCVKFHPDYPNILLSGGWDSTVQIYDVRSGIVENALYGPHVCGDSLDVFGMNLLAGSWSTKKTITLWDLRTHKQYKEVPLDAEDPLLQAYCYSAKFSRTGEEFAISTSNTNMFRMYDMESYSTLASTTQMLGSCYCIDFSYDGKSLAYGCADGKVRVYGMNKF